MKRVRVNIRFKSGEEESFVAVPGQDGIMSPVNNGLRVLTFSTEGRMLLYNLDSVESWDYSLEGVDDAGKTEGQ